MPDKDSCITPFSSEIRNLIDTEKWRYAKTMPKWPHEYILRKNVDEALFVAMVKHIRAHGYLGYFYSREITYYDEAGLTYWTMGAPVDETILINRCPKENTFGERKKAGTLPDK